MAKGRPVCAICKKPGRWIPIVGKSRVAACAKHDKAIATGLAVTGSAIKAGVITGMEMARPGLYETLREGFWTMRGVVDAIRGEKK